MPTDAKCKKILNSVSSCVRDNLIGYVAQHSSVRLATEHDIVFRADIEELKNRGQVTIVTGGGSGHEPCFAGMVGKGLASAAVAGAIFTSPTPEAALAAIRLAGKNNAAGVLTLILNYTGDRLNFGLAMERAKIEGIRSKMIVVSDDCALQSRDKSAGPRGIAGGVLIMKVAGAMAQQGKNLDEIYEYVKDLQPNLRSIAVSLSSCSVPGSGFIFSLSADEFELGTGVHGEAGVRRAKLETAHELVDTMLSHMIDPNSATRLQLDPSDDVCILVNNLGGASQFEMNIATKEALQQCNSKLGLKVVRVFSGTMLTSLEMQGFSISLLKIMDPQTIGYLDYPTDASAWPIVNGRIGTNGPFWDPVNLNDPKGEQDEMLSHPEIGPEVDQEIMTKILNCISSACKSLIASENKLNDLDKEGGDGDCGATMARGSRAILDFIRNSKTLNPGQVFLSLSKIAESSMGGSSGALYSLFLNGVAGSIIRCKSDISIKIWIEAADCGLQDIMTFGLARPGDRTMVDPLHALVDALKSGNVSDPQFYSNVLSAVQKSALATSKMNAKAGRASYVDPERLARIGHPDPGAQAVSIWVEAALKTL